MECIKKILLKLEVLEGKDINNLFEELSDCFVNLGEKKFIFPNEFVKTMEYYKNGEENIIKTFSELDNRYLFLSDFYDYCKIKKLFKE